MKTLSIYLLVILTTFLGSCVSTYPTALNQTSPSNNNTYTVSYLFEHEGVKVYRFYDNGQYVYFTNCGGEMTSINNDSIGVRIQTIK
ncbi:DUF4884 domain-containing protein [Dysgonomonas sp. 216]|uniref:DUF4884 domain-containing protein n=1 Tax=Dysgonomonas sp. 216 TaxID=2302934 RepID=UPI0013D22E55|nr:DUF4884 domain-containing protein [Dysgonomonas sp. 216]NDW17953.1 DUF4884 domain-containing protein [Dysgonomonas sp. 216]